MLSRDDLARLREVTASQGLMLESINPDLVVHQGSPTKHPAKRLETIRAAGELRDPVHYRDPRRHRRDAPTSGLQALEALADVHAEYGHIQEVILQNFVPHPRYYGREVAEIADAAVEGALERRATGSPLAKRGAARVVDRRVGERHDPRTR